MTVEEKLNNRMKDAMRNKNAQELDALRMVKSAAQTAKAAPGFPGVTDDAFWLDVIGKYVKQQQRSVIEFEKAGDAGKDHIDRLKFEIDYFSEFLPKKLGEAELNSLVKQAIQETGALNAKMAGKVMGHIMKIHKDSVDAEMLKRLVTEALGA